MDTKTDTNTGVIKWTLNAPDREALGRVADIADKIEDAVMKNAKLAKTLPDVAGYTITAETCRSVLDGQPVVQPGAKDKADADGKGETDDET